MAKKRKKAAVICPKYQLAPLELSNHIIVPTQPKMVAQICSLKFFGESFLVRRKHITTIPLPRSCAIICCGKFFPKAVTNGIEIIAGIGE